jgi:hypothetical protein
MDIQPDTMMKMNIGAGLVSSGISAFGSYEKGQAEKAADDYNAQITIEQMHQKMQTSEEEFSALMGRQRALYAKAGVDISSGSPALILASTAYKESLDQQRIKEGGEQRAALLRWEGSEAAHVGEFGAFSTFLTGLAGAGQKWWQMKEGNQGD